MPPLARNSVKRSCAVCERSLLTGERAIRFSPNGEDFVDVCPLCQELAADYGWVKEGSPTSPTVPNQRRRKRRGIASLFDPRRQPPDDPVVAEPILRRLENWFYYYFRDFVPQVGAVHGWRSPGAADRLRAKEVSTCSECHQSFLPCLGEIGLAVDVAP